MMEDYSANSSVHKSVSEGTTTVKSKDLAEESGWTAYFEDLSDKEHQQNSSGSSFSCSSSLISDAATTAAAWKISQNVFACSSTCFTSSKIAKNLILKKTRTREICEDDSLEDTASSPLNNPKVGYLKSNDMSPRKREDQIHGSLGKETASEKYSEIQTIEEENKMNFDHGIIKNDCTAELKKRGLCLAPLSMLVNYLD